ncbi:MAG: M67 family metallopeptidase [Selenomonadaceae bacterium]|nr:M67 family metallopeptidase [Selenomonadaceae bacterium]MBR4696674.1 M67 family metallopeptidase [Selenomonadaceae bacterium]
MVILTREQYDSIVAHAKKHTPLEACGLIGGKLDGDVKTVGKVYLLTNTDASAEHFSMDPNEQFAAVKDMRARGIGLLGNFHSHPATPSRPSEEDKRLAYDTRASYLILSLAGEEPVLNSFRIDRDKNVTKEELRILD